MCLVRAKGHRAVVLLVAVGRAAAPCPLLPMLDQPHMTLVVTRRSSKIGPGVARQAALQLRRERRVKGGAGCLPPSLYPRCPPQKRRTVRRVVKKEVAAVVGRMVLGTVLL